MDDDEDEEYSNEFSSVTSHHRLAIRRNLRRSIPNLRSSPYHSNSINIRRRQREHSRIIAPTINNFISNLQDHNNDNHHHQQQQQMNVTTSTNDQGHQGRIIDEHFLVSSDEENHHDDFEVLLDLSQSTPIQHDPSNESYHSLSTIDDDNDEHFYYYPSTTMESILPPTNPVNLIEYSYDNQYSSAMNNNTQGDEREEDDDDEEEEDLSIEIILESSENNSLVQQRRRRRSIVSSNPSGLRLAEICNIPQKLYSSFLAQLNEKSSFNTQCVICLEDFQLIDSIKILHCQHIFHTTCINEWLRTHSNCAYCRAAVATDILRMTTTGIGGRRRRQRIRTRRNNTIESSTVQRQA